VSRRSFPAVLIFAAIVLGAAGAARADFDEAMGYFKAGKYLEAAAQFQGMVDATPAYDYGHYMLGHCLLRVGRAGDAERSFRTAIELRGDKPEYHHGLAVALKDQRRYLLALGVLTAEARLVRDGRTAYAFLALRGYLFAALRRWPESIADLQRALSLKRDPMLLDLLGRANFSVGRFDRAAAAFSAVLDVSPDDPRLRRMLAESLLQFAAAVEDPARKKAIYERAAEAAEPLRRLEPGDLDVASLRGRAALGAARYPEAEESFRSILAAQPGACHALVNLSRALLAQGRADEAEAALNDALKCAPAMAEVHEGLGRVYFRQKRFERALDAFRRSEAIRPSPSARAGMEAVRVKLGVRRD
jgi:cytochrome c-type biogenesis protein CcmH/NrfG